MEIYLLLLAVLIILLILSGAFSSLEVAFFSLSNFELAQLEDDYPVRGKRVKKLLEEPDRLLNGILLGNLIVNICATAVATVVSHHFGLQLGLSEQIIYVIDVFVMTLMLLIFSEISPKIYAVSNPKKLAVSLVSFISAWVLFSRPFINLLTFFSSWFKGLITRDSSREILEEELKMMVDLTAEKGDLEQEEKQMIHNIFHLTDTMVREIMVPRIDIQAIAIDTPMDEVLEILKETGYSRLPVFENDLDSIVGLFYAKDLLSGVYDFKDEKDIRSLVRDVYYVPETKRCAELLRDFQERGVYMGVVVDEYGGTEGLISVEDLMEEIVGEIQDEHDIEEPEFVELGNGSYLVDGLMNIDDLSEKLGVDLSGEGYETLGGFIFTQFGRIAHPGEMVEAEGYRFIITRLVKRRISKARIDRIVNVDRDSAEDTRRIDGDSEDSESGGRWGGGQ